MFQGFSVPVLAWLDHPNSVSQIGRRSPCDSMVADGRQPVEVPRVVLAAAGGAGVRGADVRVRGHPVEAALRAGVVGAGDPLDVVVHRAPKTIPAVLPPLHGVEAAHSSRVLHGALGDPEVAEFGSFHTSQDWTLPCQRLAAHARARP